MVHKYGKLFKVNLLGEEAIVLNSGELLKKAFADEGLGDVFNDRPQSVTGKWIVFNSSDILFANVNKPIKILQSMLQRCLKLYERTDVSFDKEAEMELTRLKSVLEESKGGNGTDTA